MTLMIAKVDLPVIWSKMNNIFVCNQFEEFVFLYTTS